MSFQCEHPKLCIWCFETDNPKKLICLLNNFDINYHNINKIKNCQLHKTYQQLKIKRNINNK